MAAIREKHEQPPDGFDYTQCWPAMYGIAWPGADLIRTMVYPSVEATADELAYLRRYYRNDAIVTRPITWREREQCSLLTTPVWANSTFWWDHSDIYASHFVSVSESDRTLLSYVQSDQKGARGIRTPIKPGRYLTKYFKDILSENQIKFYAAWQVSGAYPSSYNDADVCVLSFATTPDEIEEVYTTGPTSCMSGPRRNYSGDCHPSRVYGAGDLAIAYLTVDEKPVARCLTWPDRKVMSRVYPNTYSWREDGFESQEQSENAATELLNRLKALGYSTGSDNPRAFDGARLLRLNEECDSGRTTMPYLDHYGFSDAPDGDGFVMRRNGDYSADRTDGVAAIEEEYAWVCNSCDDQMHEDDEQYTVYTAWRNGRASSSRVWCVCCTENNTFYCDATNETYDENVGCTVIADGCMVNDGWRDDNCYESDLSGTWFVEDDDPSVERSNGETWSTSENDKYPDTDDTLPPVPYNEAGAENMLAILESA